MAGTTIEELLSHGGWARRLASALIADPHQAEDVVQDAWVAALTRPPRSEGSAKAWLGKVMRNVVRNRRRADARRIEREASVARGELQPSSDDIAQELEMHRALVDALAAIDAAQARTVVRRYFHGLTSAEIAREERVPESTVRNRLMRGLEALRARLDGTYGDRSTWAALLLPLASRNSTFVVPASGAVIGIGVLGKLLAAAVVLGFGLVALRARTDASEIETLLHSDPPKLSNQLEVPAPPAGRIPASPEVAETTRSAPPSNPTAIAGPASEEPSRLEARIVDTSGVPIRGAELLVIDRLDFGEIDRAAAPRATSGSDGRISLEVRRSDRSTKRGSGSREACNLGIQVSADGRETRRERPTIVPGRMTSLGDLALRAGGTIRGRVNFRGGPPCEARVQIITPDITLEMRALPRTQHVPKIGIGPFDVGTDGMYEASGIPVGTYRVATTSPLPGFFHSFSEVLEVRAGANIEAPDLVLESNPHRIHGKLLQADGEPVVNRTFEVSFRSRPGGIGPAPSTETATDGTFEIYPPSEGYCDIYCRAFNESEGEAFAREVPTGTTDLVMTLETPEYISILVQDERFAPIQSYTLAQEFDDGMGRSDSGPRPEGRSKLLLRAKPFQLTVSAEGYAEQEVGPIGTEPLPSELVLTMCPMPSVRGRVTLDGQPFAKAKVSLQVLAPADSTYACNGFPSRFGEAGMLFHSFARTDEQGRFTLTARKAGTYVVLVEARGHPETESHPIEQGPAFEGADVELAIGRGGSLEGRVIAAAGESPEGTIVGISRGDWTIRTAFVGADGSYRFTGLAAGEWSIRRCEKDFAVEGTRSVGLVGGFHPSLARFQVDEGRTTVFDLDLSQASCTLEGRFFPIPPAGSGWTARMTPKGTAMNAASGSPLESDGSLRLSASVLGPHALQLAWTGSPDRDQVIEDAVELHRGVNAWSLEFPVGALEGEATPGSLLVHRWRNARGTTCTTHFLADASGKFLVEGIPAGPGSLEVLGTEITVEVAQGETSRIAIR